MSFGISKLENKGKLKAIVTQNIDNLHTLAGSKNVYELHGSVMRNYCMKCHKYYDGNFVFNSKEIPRCDCGGIIKPDVVLYEEGLDDDVVSKSITAIAQSDLLIVAGTSLTVYPASSFINYYKGNKLVIINKDSTSYDINANLVINDTLKNIFSKLK